MASTIKVDNIQDQCGSAVVTKCGASKTLTVTTTKADNYQAADGGNIINQSGTTITLGASGDTISLAAGASQTGFGRTGTVDWDTTAKTAGFTAVSGNGYFVNTTSGAVTVTLPAGSAGSIVSLKDYANTWQTNNVTVTPNGTDKIGGVNASAILNTEDQSVTLVYVDSTQGWRAVQDSTSGVSGDAFISATGGCITTSGDYKIHTFTSPGTFCITGGGGALAKLDYLVVAGGGGGANNSGGGGGGGFRESKCSTVSGCWTASPLASGTSLGPFSPGGIPVTVGAGGAAGIYPSPALYGSRGSNSIFSSITSTGGGGGSQYGNPTTNANAPGGSGGGGNVFGGAPPCGTAGGTGNTPSVSPSQGNPGGPGGKDNGPSYPSAGGGGAGGVGGAGGLNSVPNTQPGGPGGAGVTTSITSSPLGFSGGGGGGVWGNNAGGSAGPNGGGAAGNAPSRPGTYVGENGTANRGGGGGGSSSPDENNYVSPAGTGGSGIVIIRYKFQ